MTLFCLWVTCIFKWNHTLSFCDWLISASIMSSRFIYVVALSEFSSFWVLNNIPLYVYTCFVYPVIADECLGCFHLSVIMNNASMNIYHFGSPLILLDIHPEVGLLAYGNSTFNFLRNHHTVFHRWLHCFSFWLTGHKCLQFLHILANTCHLLFLIVPS